MRRSKPNFCAASYDSVWHNAGGFDDRIENMHSFARVLKYQLIIECRSLFAQANDMFFPVPRWAEPGEGLRECGVVPVAGDPGGVVHDA